ncbi:MAG TPA: DUF4908 domain-containing protein [Rhizomicrobium sp.]|nr:DUF4908 domain-containing protein [Rhizomicrobium sp.]
MVGLRPAIAGAFFLVATSLACATDADRSLQARLSSDHLGRLEPGRYLAGEKAEFELSSAGACYLLRFGGSPEVFVVTADNAPMGGRVLRYDSGETALQVSGWGGVTLYTDANPGGLPAVRTGVAPTLSPATASSDDIRVANEDLADDVKRSRRINMAFLVDWSNMPDTPFARARALDAMENIARGIERLGRSARWRQALSRRVSDVRLTKGATPAVKLSGKTLLITFNPDGGYEGRASSRAIASALGTLLGTPSKQS